MTRPIRIAVVDDHGAVFEALREVLDDQPGMRVVGVAQDADEAVALVERHAPDLVLMDVRMPRGGGALATRLIRDRSPLTRVLALSAHGDRASVLEMLRAGAVGYVVKGAPVGELVSAIRSAVEGGRPLSARITDEVAAELSERLSWEEYDERHIHRQRTMLHAALREGVQPAYQPIFDLRDGSLAGIESLARFPQHPTVPVRVWFEAAEQVGLSAELEVAALRAGILGARDRPDGVYLAVNLSPACLQSAPVHEALRDMDLSGVVLELTEHARVTDYDTLAGLLGPLRAEGVRLAVDDTGSGYASLRHILRLAPDFIKLDIGLTSGIDQEPPKRALASALVTFAREIGATVVAEGVETMGEADMLGHLGICFAQGYALGRPAPFRQAVAAAAAAGAAARRR